MAKMKSKRSGPVRLCAVESVAAAGHAAAPDISHLNTCIEDARQAALDGDPGPADPTDFDQLRGRLETARGKFPPLYRAEFVEPYIAKLNELGPAQFAQILIGDPRRESTAGLMLDMAHAILQRSDRFQIRASNAFQEVVGDLYDGFLSAEDRQGVNQPDNATTPPLVKWGNPDSGPYTWPVDATTSFGARAAVVNMPPSNARKGLLAWSALGHETGGHDILHADDGLQDQLAANIATNLSSLGGPLADYWSLRIDETASDVMGILNMGPAAGIGLIGYFRGLNKAFSGSAVLRNSGPANDPHPADIVRGYLAAEVVALLPFSQSAAWSKVIASETDKDVTTIVLAGKKITPAVARESAKRVATAIATTKVESLENHALADIQTWRDSDEKKVADVRVALTTAGELPEQGPSRIFATHIVAAAVIEGLANGADLAVVFERMVDILAKLHAKNPVWGPLFVRHPGNIRRDLAYVPHRRVVVEE
ncbi:MAG: hypothetical protein QOI12_1728 [Alphaproteobacteria bacterium]|jgi:hypothetical protein|nr:hypothetical protein [Alphaproteobacteria bacterium]